MPIRILHDHGIALPAREVEAPVAAAAKRLAASDVVRTTCPQCGKIAVAEQLQLPRFDRRGRRRSGTWQTSQDVQAWHRRSSATQTTD